MTGISRLDRRELTRLDPGIHLVVGLVHIRVGLAPLGHGCQIGLVGPGGCPAVLSAVRLVGLRPVRLDTLALLGRHVGVGLGFPEHGQLHKIVLSGPVV